MAPSAIKAVVQDPNFSFKLRTNLFFGLVGMSNPDNVSDCPLHVLTQIILDILAIVTFGGGAQLWIDGC